MSSPSDGAGDDGCSSCPGDGCRDRRPRNDLDTLLATPDFAGSVLACGVAGVAGHLPTLDQVVAVTVAGPVFMNDVGTHEAPVGPGGPIRCRPSRITLRLNPERLGAALVTEPAAHMPPTLRLFDAEGNTAHATYLTEESDRLAFESLTLAGGRLDDHRDRSPAAAVGAATDPSPTPDADQIDLFDAILDDGGARRLVSLPAHGADGYTRVEARPVVAALEHAALLGMPVTVATAASGCLQMRHDHLDGAREHRGSMVLAAGSCRAMIDFTTVAQSWITWNQGVWGRTGAIELYDRHGRCSMVLTQTGSVAAETHSAWDHLLTDLAGV